MATKPIKSFAEEVSAAQVMHTALKANATQVEKRGIDTAFTEKLAKLRNEAIALNDQQEKLKADLKAKTDELNAKMTELRDLYREAKKIVKLDFAQAQWKEFGIEDKR
ncbi:hypothetical protein ACT4R9_00255 [Ornithobacterium rhinotracheale]|uniref:hypothetical protein n=1 Tax=Ornithobacterium rhinotracheale TaxID=28251 RepID=UPI003FA49B91